MKRIVMTVIVMLLLVCAGGLIYIYSGSYDVAATSQDSAMLNWILKTTREESIDRRADNVRPPSMSVLSDPKTLRVGFEHYNEMCIVCHGAPGIEPGEAHAGLNPKPPLLTKVAKHISRRELFWVIKHGIKMTGMPAWGPTHSDDKIWAMVAFVKTLPDMTPAQYKALQQSETGADTSHAHDDAAHSH